MPTDKAGLTALAEVETDALRYNREHYPKTVARIEQLVRLSSALASKEPEHG